MIKDSKRCPYVYNVICDCKVNECVNRKFIKEHLEQQSFKKKAMIKNFIYSTLIGAFVFALFYLIGSFYSVSFNISKWTFETKGFISTIGGIFALISFVISFLFNLNEKLKI
jgi:hypothetical protein